LSSDSKPVSERSRLSVAVLRQGLTNRRQWFTL